MSNPFEMSSGPAAPIGREQMLARIAAGEVSGVDPQPPLDQSPRVTVASRSPIIETQASKRKLAGPEQSGEARSDVSNDLRLEPETASFVVSDVGSDWRSSALCRNEDPDLFFPTKSQPRIIEAAKAVCRGCTVILECLDTARDDDGIWGGMTQDERRRLKRRNTGQGNGRNKVA
jgi:WhiB family redox-sensing transcriptional regulator